jgi:hypothetical protein
LVVLGTFKTERASQPTNFSTFLQQNGSTLNAAPPEIIFDANVQCYILIHTLFSGNNAVYYTTTQSLANPSWSDSTPILGTAQVITDPGGEGIQRCELSFDSGRQFQRIQFRVY